MSMSSCGLEAATWSALSRLSWGFVFAMLSLFKGHTIPLPPFLLTILPADLQLVLLCSPVLTSNYHCYSSCCETIPLESRHPLFTSCQLAVCLGGRYYYWSNACRHHRGQLTHRCTGAKFVPPSHIHTRAEGARGGWCLVPWFLATSSTWDTNWECSTMCWDPWAEPELKGTLYTFCSTDALW
jgi:hypothetical protein